MTNSSTHRIVCSALAAALLASATAHAQCEPQQTAKILPAKPGTNFAFWNGDVSLRGNRLFVSNSWAFEAPDNSGAVWVYERGPDDQWSRTAVLVCPAGNPWKMFGTSIATEGDLAVIAAGGWDAPKNDGAYAFVRGPQGEWNFEAKIVPNDWTEFQYLSDVSLSGDTLLLAAPGDGAGGWEYGATYVFRRSPEGKWTQEAKLLASDPHDFDNFGHSVSLSGDRAVIGMSPWYDYGGGRFYIFERGQSDEWTQRAVIHPPDFDGLPAGGVAARVSGSTIVAWASYSIDEQVVASQVYIYRHRSGDLWELEATPRPDEWPEDLGFGGPLDLTENLLLVGSFRADVNGNNSGITFCFSRHPDGTWPETAHFFPADNGPEDGFGSTVDLDGDQAAILASGDISPDDLRSSVYLFDLSGCTPCRANCDGNGSLDLFDFLCYVNLFNVPDPAADCDASGVLDLFDFLCFTNAFNAGC